MGALPPLKRLAREDFPSEQKWITSLINPINHFWKAVYGLLNNGLTFKSNFLAQVREFTFDKTATHPTADAPLEFQNTMKVKPIGVIILKIEENEDAPSAITSAVSLDWTFLDGIVQIRNIAGLTNGKKYNLTVLSIGG